MSKRLIQYVSGALIAIFAGEIAARVCFGLGDPPLSIADPKIEYMFQPNQDVMRFGNRIFINQYGMRSPNFSPVKSPGEFRVLVFGDSVVNGGAATDQAQLATSMLSEYYRKKWPSRRITVGNVSAGSWGPGNWLGYAEKYGFFDADVVILVISSNDYADNPTFEPLNPLTHPMTKPLSSLYEGLIRYLPQVLHANGGSGASEGEPKPPSEADIRVGLGDLTRFLTLAWAHTKRVLVFQFPEKEETNTGMREGYFRILKTVTELGISIAPLAPRFAAAIQAGANPYRDNIHPNAAGQSLLCDAFVEALGSQGS